MRGCGNVGVSLKKIALRWMGVIIVGVALDEWALSNHVAVKMQDKKEYSELKTHFENNKRSKEYVSHQSKV